MPSSKLSAYCDKIIEMGWLAAVIAAPLFFNVYSSRVFEPDKLTLVRSIAVVMSVAWLVKWVEGLTHSQRAPSGLGWRTPLVVPTFILVATYLISTLFSVAPRTSLWGSYQRLQGTYTTFSYIVIFFMILQGLRDKRQLERLILTIIITSLPIALYGLVQRYKLDPLPWGGDVTTRVASNMGNAIFVAAYLIMAFFLTLARIFESFRAILVEEEAYISDILRASIYFFIAAVQSFTIILTLSRGPLIGWMAGAFVFGLVLLVDLRRQATSTEADETKQGIGPVKKWGWLAWITTALVLILALVAFNILPSSPFIDNLRSNRIIGRLGRVFETEGGTGKVRTLIWEGAAQLVWLHEPLQFPGGQADPYNAIRPLIGYGPESMYVAYNRFYQPDLAHYEQRNASPDRSHNETFDALVITGLIGFLAEQLVFISIFIYGFHWIGMMPTRREGYLFIGLWVGLGTLGAIAAAAWDGAKMIGVGVPVGISLGIVIYLAIYAMFLYDPAKDSGARSPHQLLMVSLLAAIFAHYVEIHFGIAIASTRTIFWTMAGMLVVVGLGWVRAREAAPAPPPAPPAATEHTSNNIPQHKKRRRTRAAQTERASAPSRARAMPEWVGSISAYTLVGAIILSTFFYEFVTNAERLSNPITIIWRALTTLPAQQYRTSFAMLGLLILVWLLSGVLVLSELSRTKVLRNTADFTTGAMIYYLVSISIAVIFALLLASHLANLTRPATQQIDVAGVVQIAERIASVLSYYYGMIFLIIFVAAGLLLIETHQPGLPWARGVGAVIFIPALVAAIVTISYSNLDPIRADIIYKQGDPYDKQSQWDVSIAHYKRAIELAPNEDFYYLFLGRSFLEKARAAQNPTVHSLNEQSPAEAVLKLTWQQTAQLSKQDLLIAAKAVLLEAREINPLNTDHSANLARLYRTWADMAATPEEKQQRTDQSLEYYQDATNLSPNNAVLWNEWGTVYFYLKNDITTAEQKLAHSLELDSRYEQTYLILGEMHTSQKQFDKAVEAYKKVLEIKPKHTQARSVLCYLYAQQSKLDEAIACNQALIELTPKDWNAFKNMAILFDQKGNLTDALSNAQTALSLAPKEQITAVNAYVEQLKYRLTQPPQTTPVITSTRPVTP